MMSSRRSSTSTLLVGIGSFLRSLKMLTCVVQDVTQGCPYDTGTLNTLTPQYKRIASIQGDITFQGPRRFFLEHLAREQNAWSFGTTPFHLLIYPTVSRSYPSEQHHEIHARSRFRTQQPLSISYPPGLPTFVALGAWVGPVRYLRG